MGTNFFLRGCLTPHGAGHRQRFARFARAALVLIAMLIAPTLVACGDIAPAAGDPPETPANTSATINSSDKSCGLRAGLYTQIPDQTKKQSEFMRDLLCSIDNTQSGQSIKLSTFKIQDANIADALIRAHHRGASVQIVIDGTTAGNNVVRGLQQQLGTDPTQRSFILGCDKSCAHPGRGVHHSKVIAFSDTGKVVVGSTNLAPDNLYGSSGVDYVLDAPEFYDVATAFVDSLRDPKQAANPTGVSVGELSLSFSPYDDPDDEPIGKVLRQVSCDPTNDDADAQNTSIDVAMYDATWGRRDAIERLGQLAADGCTVRVIINGLNDQFQQERAEVSAFLQDQGATVVYPVSEPFLMHDKLMAINGTVSGKHKYVTILGSQNLTRNARSVNTESTLRSEKLADYQSVHAHFNAVLDQVR